MTNWLFGHRRSLLFLISAIALAGAALAFRMPVSLFPTIDFPRVVVSVDAGDRPVDRMVIEVTRPLEQSLREIPGVRRIRSTSSRGSAEISITFGWRDDMVAAMLQTDALIARTLPDLPAGVVYRVRRMDPTVFPFLGVSLTSANADQVRLRDIAYYQIAPAISAIEGVGQVEVLGGRQAEIQVDIDPERLRALGLTAHDVATALSANNLVASVGRIEDRHRLYLTLIQSQLTSADDVGATILRTGQAGIVELSDVADVREGVAPDYTRVSADGRDAVLINVRQQPGANTVALASAVRAELAQLGQHLPSDVRLANYYDQSELVTQAAGSVRDAILIGALLAAAVLFGFLRQAKITLVIALILPLVLAASVLGLSALGQSFNIMTLGGMAAAVGLIIDDAVVMLEHIAKRSAAGDGDVRHGAAEMIKPLTGSSFATVVVFAPLAFVDGVTGGFFRALAVTMAIALFVSYFCALIIVPFAAQHLLSRDQAERLEHGGPLLGRLRGAYQGLLALILGRPLIPLAVAAAFIVVGGFAATRVGSGFMPAMDEGGFILDYKAPPGTSLAETDRLVRLLEEEVRATPEVANYSRRTGLQLGGGLTEANEGDLFIRLHPLPRRDIEAVMSDLRGRLAARVPALQVETAQLMEDLIGDLISNPQPIEIKITGAPSADLIPIADAVAQQAGQVRGVVEVFNGVLIAGDAIDVSIDRTRAAIEGLTPEEVRAAIESQLGGVTPSGIQQGEKIVPVRVWAGGDVRERLSRLQAMTIRTQAGAVLPLSRVADIAIAVGQPQIVREDLRDMIAVTARLEGRDLGSAINDIRASLRSVNLPPGVTISFGGLYQEQQKSFRDLTIVLAAAALLVAALLLYLYENIAIVAAIMSVAALSALAVYLGLWLTGVELNISALMGMTMIIGIVTEIAVFYFAEIDASRKAGKSDLIAAGAARLRPILMTTLIAILALSPLALGLGAGSAMQRPLAIAIISGLVFAAPLALLIMPAIYFAASGGYRRAKTQPALPQVDG